VIINKNLIGSKLLECSFDNFIDLSEKHTLALNACRDVAKGLSSGVVLLGPPGRGKTHLLISIAQYFSADRKLRVSEDGKTIFIEDAGNSVVYWPFREMAGVLREGAYEGVDRDIIDVCKHTDMLILDDFGAEKPSDFTVGCVEEIIEYRSRMDLPICISSNLELNVIREIYGSRIVSRLSKMCRIISIDTDVDYRIKKRGENNG